jgi:hypothetical protein
LGPDGGPILAELLTLMAGSLKVLDLETAELEDDGVQGIVSAYEGIGRTTVLEKLDLADNDLGETSLDVLMNLDLPKLKVLSLKGNMDLEEEDLEDKKALLKSKFASIGCIVLIDEDDELVEVQEEPDEQVDELADQLAGVL